MIGKKCPNTYSKELLKNTKKLGLVQRKDGRFEFFHPIGFYSFDLSASAYDEKSIMDNVCVQLVKMAFIAGMEKIQNEMKTILGINAKD